MAELQKTDSLQAVPIHLLSVLPSVTTQSNMCFPQVGDWKEIIIMALEVSFVA